MIEYGITTTAAEFWVHYHPLEGKVFSYRVYRMKEHVAGYGSVSLAHTGSRVTGAGYLVKKREGFIQSADVEAASWENLTKERAGKMGEDAVIKFLEQGRVPLPGVIPRPARIVRVVDFDEQVTGIDCWAAFEWFRVPIEIKTETFMSQNLFVQVAERR